MILPNFRQILDSVIRFSWVVVDISCGLMTYFIILSFLRLLSAVFCLCKSRNPFSSLYYKVEAKLYKWLLGYLSSWFAETGYQVFEHGDDISSLVKDRAFFMSNHLDSADIPLIMHKFVNTPELTENMMWIMDKSYRFTFLGWVAACHGDFFIRPGKQNREAELTRLGNHIRTVFHRLNRRWLVLFPEGGFFEQRRKANDAFVEENSLPVLKHITLPRFGALTTCYNAFRECRDDNAMPKWLIDVTIAYPKNQRFPNLGDLFLRRTLPVMTVHMYYRVYKVSDIPFADLSELKKWMYDLYYQKEAMLGYFYTNGSFPPSSSSISLCGLPQFLPGSVVQYSWKFYAKIHLFFIGCYFLFTFIFAMSLRGANTLFSNYFKEHSLTS